MSVPAGVRPRQGLSTSPDRHGLLFIGECGRLLHAEADSAEEQARWLALCDKATLSRDEVALVCDEAMLVLMLDIDKTTPASAR